MFEVGFTEIVLIFGIALLVLGPARLPKLAADLGRWAGRARSMARQLRTQLEQEVRFDPLATNDTSASGKASTASPAANPTIHSPTPLPASTPVPAADATARATPLQPVAAIAPATDAAAVVTEPAATSTVPVPEDTAASQLPRQDGH